MKTIYHQIHQENNLRKAFEQVKKNKGAGGIDNQDIKNFSRHLDIHIHELKRLLEQKRYKPLPVKRVYIPKPNKKKRPLGIPTIRDRVVQQALLDILEPVFEPTFHECSYGFRPNRSAHQAVLKVEELLKQGHHWIVDADIEDFFGSLNHDHLLNTLKEEIEDQDILKLIKAFLKSGVMEEGKLRYITTGTPQGGVISPLLANVYLNYLDHNLWIRGYKMIRYADDFVVFANTQKFAQRALKLTEKLFRRKRLRLSEEKTRIVHIREGFDFLGFHFFQGKDKNIYKTPRDKSKKSFKEKLCYLTRRQQPKNLKMIIEKVNPIIRGWGNYFKIGNVKGYYRTMDSWIRMRLRSFVKKKRWVTLSAHLEYKNETFRKLGLVHLVDVIQYQLTLFPDTGQWYRKAVCGKSARTV